MQCVTETLLGERRFATLLRSLGVERTDAVELGRWIVHPSYRNGGRAALRLAAAGAAITIRLAHGAVARRGILICSVGTVDRQELILRRIGLLNAPMKPIACNQYDDKLQVMYCNDLQKIDVRFRVLMDEMAQIMRLPSAFSFLETGPFAVISAQNVQHENVSAYDPFGSKGA
jgi:hypothetical protein